MKMRFDLDLQNKVKRTGVWEKGLARMEANMLNGFATDPKYMCF
jgi:hypothetical protein